jgi:endoglucanase
VAAAVRRRTVRAAVLAALAATVLGCAQQPDRTLHPDPPTVTYRPLTHPFQGAKLTVDPDSEAARYERTNGADWLAPIADQPQAHWVNSPQDLDSLPVLLAAAGDQHALPVLVAYWVPNRGCSKHKQGAPTPAAYHAWIRSMIARLGATRAVVIMEPDAVSADCFDATRGEALAQAVRQLSTAGQSVYIDAGHPRWKSTGETAERLLASGIADAEGFAVNVSNRQTTATSIAWGRELSDLVGKRPFVVDVSRNGIGPPPDGPGGATQWCNPPHQALGVAPTTHTGAPDVDALLWIKRPGESDGKCGGEVSYFFSPRQARQLIVNSPHIAPAAREAAVAATAPPASTSPVG